MSSCILVPVIRLATIALAALAPTIAGQAPAKSLGSYGDPYAEAAGLRPLRFQALPRGVREIRVWIGGGLGWPQDLFRLIERQGHVTGEYIRYWHLKNYGDDSDSESFAALMRYYERGRCEPIRRGRSAEACRALFQTEPDWQAVWSAADSLGVWTLPDGSTRRIGNFIVTDGWGITVELRDGTAYRAWEYSDPDVRPSPESARAEAFANAMQPVRALLRRSAAEHTYVGRLDVRNDTLEFSQCAGGGPWLIELYDERLDRLRGDSATRAPRRLEVRGMFVPDSVARDRDLPRRFQGTVQAASVLSIAPWTPEACTTEPSR